MRWRGERVRVRLAPGGHVAPSRYFGPTQDGTCILQRFGVGLVGPASNTEIFAIAIAGFAARMWPQSLSLARFRYGALERP